MKDIKKRYWKVTPCNDRDYIIIDEGEVDAIKSWLEQGDSGFSIDIKIVEMTEKEYEKLPEYGG